jgi:hypothetical protein
LEETYVLFAGTVFQQIKGIPMGGNASPLLADLTLCGMEYDYMKATRIPRPLVVRYIDDLLVINNPNFATTARQIYDPSLKLDITHNGRECFYLDLDVKVINGRVEVGLYNKTDSFPFVVNRFGFPCSNVALHSHSTVIFSQLIRFCRIIDSAGACVSACNQMIQLYRNRGFKEEFLRKVVRQFAKRNKPLLARYFYPSRENTLKFFTNVCKSH